LTSLRIIWLGLMLRVIVAFLNAYHGPTVGAAGDAAGFHDIAVEFSQTLRPNQVHLGLVYAWGLGVLYYLTYPSLFLGGIFSAIAWLASANVLLHIMRLLEFRGPQRVLVMCVYAIYPSSILLTGVTLREAYQLLSINLAVYAALNIYLHARMRHWMLLIASVLVGGLLQPGILVFGGFIVAATAALLVKKRRRIGETQVVLAVAFAALMIGLGAFLFWRLYDYRLEAGLATAIESYQRGALSIPARTHYKTDVDVGGTGGFAAFVFTGMFQYLFEPMPWRPLLLVDVAPVFENLVRAVLLGCALFALLVMRSRRRTPVALIFGCWLALELLFSVGTVNWGTAARHHVLSTGLLAVCAVARQPRRQGLRAEPAARPERLIPEGASA
jgi:hypothetical protein